MLPPFGDGASPNSLSSLLDNVLEGCGFAPFAGPLTTDPSYYLEPAEADNSLNPKFSFTVSRIDEVASRLPVSEDQMEIVVSARSRRLKRYFPLGRWSLPDAPARWSPESQDLAALPPGGDTDFIVAIRIVADGPALSADGLGPGKVLCRREFAVRRRVDAVAFPFSWREFGADTEYPPELLWAIRWKDADTDADRFARPIDDVLTVYMNKAAEPRLVAMNAAAGKGDLAWRMLASEIMTLIWSEVLKGTWSTPDPTDQETLAGQVYARLAKASGKAYDDLPAMAEEHGLLELRSHIAKILGVVQ